MHPLFTRYFTHNNNPASAIFPITQMRGTWKLTPRRSRFEPRQCACRVCAHSTAAGRLQPPPSFGFCPLPCLGCGPRGGQPRPDRGQQQQQHPRHHSDSAMRLSLLCPPWLEQFWDCCKACRFADPFSRSFPDPGPLCSPPPRLAGSRPPLPPLVLPPCTSCSGRQRSASYCCHPRQPSQSRSTQKSMLESLLSARHRSGCHKQARSKRKTQGPGLSEAQGQRLGEKRTGTDTAGTGQAVRAL